MQNFDNDLHDDQHEDGPVGHSDDHQSHNPDDHHQDDEDNGLHLVAEPPIQRSHRKIYAVLAVLAVALGLFTYTFSGSELFKGFIGVEHEDAEKKADDEFKKVSEYVDLKEDYSYDNKKLQKFFAWPFTGSHTTAFEVKKDLEKSVMFWSDTAQGEWVALKAGAEFAQNDNNITVKNILANSIAQNTEIKQVCVNFDYTEETREDLGDCEAIRADSPNFEDPGFEHQYAEGSTGNKTIRVLVRDANGFVDEEFFTAKLKQGAQAGVDIPDNRLPEPSGIAPEDDILVPGFGLKQSGYTVLISEFDQLERWDADSICIDFGGSALGLCYPWDEVVARYNSNNNEEFSYTYDENPEPTSYDIEVSYYRGGLPLADAVKTITVPEEAGDVNVDGPVPNTLFNATDPQNTLNDEAVRGSQWWEPSDEIEVASPEPQGGFSNFLQQEIQLNPTNDSTLLEGLDIDVKKFKAPSTSGELEYSKQLQQVEEEPGNPGKLDLGLLNTSIFHTAGKNKAGVRYLVAAPGTSVYFKSACLAGEASIHIAPYDENVDLEKSLSDPDFVNSSSIASFDVYKESEDCGKEVASSGSTGGTTGGSQAQPEQPSQPNQPVPAEEDSTYGDINGDGEITLADPECYTEVFVHEEYGCVNNTYDKVDLTCNGEIDLLDLNAIIFRNLERRFPGEGEGDIDIDIDQNFIPDCHDEGVRFDSFLSQEQAQNADQGVNNGNQNAPAPQQQQGGNTSSSSSSKGSAPHSGPNFFEQEQAQNAKACGDGKDNDGDGLEDFGEDPGCTSLDDDDETDNPDDVPRSTPQCSDGKDNDEDGFTDLDDPGCDDAYDNNEVDGEENIQPADISGGSYLPPYLDRTGTVISFDDIKDSYAADVIIAGSKLEYKGNEKGFSGDGDRLFKGYVESGDSEFRPNQPIRRDEIIKILVYATGYPDYLLKNKLLDDSSAGFKDVKKYWATDLINIVANQGIVDADGTFHPDANVKRSEFTKILIEMYADITGEEIEECVEGERPFADVAEYHWVCKYAKKAKELGITEGIEDRFGNTRFSPNKIVTRANAAVWLHNYFVVTQGLTFNELD